MVFENLHQQLQMLKQLLEHLPADAYTTPIRHLGMSTIGGHSRHTLEMVDCALKGYATGKIDYINRVRNLTIETDIPFALQRLSDMASQLEKPDAPLQVLVENDDDKRMISVTSSYFREINFLTDHTVHHMALIKVGLIELDIPFQDNFGIAQSTLKYSSTLQS